LSNKPYNQIFLPPRRERRGKKIFAAYYVIRLLKMKPLKGKEKSDAAKRNKYESQIGYKLFSEGGEKKEEEPESCTQCRRYLSPREKFLNFFSLSYSLSFPLSRSRSLQ
jgi:hypothetical protein